MIISKSLVTVLENLKQPYWYIINRLPEKYIEDLNNTLYYYDDLEGRLCLYSYDKVNGSAEFTLKIYNNKVEYKAHIIFHYNNIIEVRDKFCYKHQIWSMPPSMGREYKCQ